MIDNPTLIHYLVIIDDDVKGNSPFCGYNHNLFFYKDVFEKILSFPINIYEVGKNWNTITKLRIAFSQNHIIIPLLYESYIQTDNYIPFICVIYDKEKYPNIEDIRKKNWRNSPLYIDINKIDKISLIDFYNHFTKQITKFLTDAGCKYDGILEPDVYPSPQILFDSFVSNVLLAFRCKGSNMLIQSHIIGLNTSVQNILKHDRKKDKGIDCIFTTLPQYPIYYIEKMFSEQIKNSPRMRKLLKTVYKQMDYESSCLMDTDVYNTRINEVELYICFMKLVFENYMCPLIQIQPGINHTTNEFLQSVDKNKIKKQNEIKSYNKFLNEVNKYAVDGYLNFIPKNKIPRIKIYSDAPIEFFINNEYRLPIHISTNLCKIPMIPGTDFINLVSRLNETYITYEELKKILIIRSYNPEDSIKNILKERLNTQRSFTDMEITFKDVKNSNELIDIINNSMEFSIVIFDCHGRHDDEELSGVLQLEEDEFDIWKERWKVNYMPPIVLFSSCQTNVYGNTMFSTASGFLATGAKSVLATTSSVDAVSSADFIARLILKIDMFSDILNEIFPRITFLDFVANMFRVFYITDILDVLDIDESNRNRILSCTSVYINNESIYWYDYFLTELSMAMEITKAEVLTKIENKVGYCESLKYIVLGNADKIIVTA